MSTWPPEPPDLSGDDDASVDNVIVMPGLDCLPEPSPRRLGGPGRAGAWGDGVANQDDDGTHEGVGLERLDQAEAPASHLLDAAIEAMLLACDEPVTETRLDGFLGSPGVAEVRAALVSLRARYAGQAGGIRLVQVAHGWQLRTDPRFARWVSAMLGGKPAKLSRAALEVVSIVAYRQPASKADVDELRGVDSGGVLRMLVERGLIEVTGRRDEPGRPLIYGSSTGFLSMFGLRDLSDLPTLSDLHELQHDDPRLGPLPEDIEAAFGESRGELHALQQPLPLDSTELVADGRYEAPADSAEPYALDGADGADGADDPHDSPDPPRPPRPVLL